MAKPRIQWYAPGSIAALIERYIATMNARPNHAPLGESHVSTLRQLQRDPLGAVIAAALTKHDIIAYAKRLIEGVCPATINSRIGYLNGVIKYAESAWEDCEKVSYKPIKKAKLFLSKNGYVGKGVPRTRVPVEDEILRLKALAAMPPKIKHARFIKAMPDIIDFAIKSTRRISEICRIDRKLDIDLDRKDDFGNPTPMYRVRNMKDPKKRNKEKWFPLFPDLAEILFRQPEHPTDTRFFPYNAKSVGARYTQLKKQLGIEGLHFHDSRRLGATERLKTMTPHQVRHFFTGHDNDTMLARVYDATNPADGFAVMSKIQQSVGT